MSFVIVFFLEVGFFWLWLFGGLYVFKIYNKGKFNEIFKVSGILIVM